MRPEFDVTRNLKKFSKILRTKLALDVCGHRESSRRPPFTGEAECMRMVNLQSLTWHMACISDMSETMPVSASMFSDAIEY